MILLSISVMLFALTSNTADAATAIDDFNFKTACEAWVSNPTAATAEYGHIGGWNTGAVTNMDVAFYNAALFNDDISAWEASKVKAILSDVVKAVESFGTTQVMMMNGNEVASAKSFKRTRIQDQIQVSHYTHLDRYADEYRQTVEFTAQSTPTKILSFGCSTGEEAVTLATLYFPSSDVKIYGVDLDDEILNKADRLARTSKSPDGKQIPEGKITFFNGDSTTIDQHGPFDIIFANSVLCRNPALLNIGIMMDIFPVSDFEEIMQSLDESLKIGGLLAIINSNYDFMETEVGRKKYNAISKCLGNFVPRIDTENRQYIDTYFLIPQECLYQKQI
jgi:SAM-dependent methyltransferase